MKNYKDPVSTFILESILILVHRIVKAAKPAVMN